jgi:hypothetical protein
MVALLVWFAQSAFRDHAEPRRDFSRPDFKEAVLGKSRQEVIEAIGKPSETSNFELKDGRSGSRWFYYGWTKDGEKTDWGTQIEFTEGKATAVWFCDGKEWRQ